MYTTKFPTAPLTVASTSSKESTSSPDPTSPLGVPDISLKLPPPDPLHWENSDVGRNSASCSEDKIIRFPRKRLRESGKARYIWPREALDTLTGGEEKVDKKRGRSTADGVVVKRRKVSDVGVKILRRRVRGIEVPHEYLVAAGEVEEEVEEVVELEVVEEEDEGGEEEDEKKGEEEEEEEEEEEGGVDVEMADESSEDDAGEREEPGQDLENTIEPTGDEAIVGSDGDVVDLGLAYRWGLGYPLEAEGSNRVRMRQFYGDSDDWAST